MMMNDMRDEMITWLLSKLMKEASEKYVMVWYIDGKTMQYVETY